MSLALVSAAVIKKNPWKCAPHLTMLIPGETSILPCSIASLTAQPSGFLFPCSRATLLPTCEAS
jgi:hypothetical protein